MPQSSGSHVGALAPLCITPKFLHPLALPAECLSATDRDLTLETKGESGTSENSRSGSNEVCPPPSDFQGASQNSTLWITYNNLVPMTRLFQM